MRSSERALELVVRCEVGSQDAYEACFSHPTWPGARSGLTIGIGFDCGYETAQQILDDWGPFIGRQCAYRLSGVAGMQGAAAAAAAASVADIEIPWSAAVAVFSTLNVPRYETMVSVAFPHVDELPADAFGALFSLVFNRGPSIIDDPKDPLHRRREMRQIATLAAAHWWSPVPDLIRSMERLWTNGLRKRRELEAELFEGGLRSWPNPPAGAIVAARSLGGAANAGGAPLAVGTAAVAPGVASAPGAPAPGVTTASAESPG